MTWSHASCVFVTGGTGRAAGFSQSMQSISGWKEERKSQGLYACLKKTG
jgi:hypothetical protein